jgi:hypothetical protein
MTDGSYYGSPVLIDVNGTTTVLKRRTFAGTNADSYSEDWLQNLLFDRAEVLPVDEIDHAYERLVPICRELSTGAGPLDVLYATPEGRLVIVEVKLWRNPEARRKVIAQILDYATELSDWSYEDLQREVSKSTKRSGNSLYELVKERFPDTDEKRFVDDVTRSLRLGNFLLLVIGDGIREGAASIANFLDRGGNLHFSLGLVEVGVYDMPDGRRMVQPRVLARTVEIKRTVLVHGNARVELDVAEETQDVEDVIGDSVHPKKQACIEFWKGFLDGLQLDDQSQPIPKNGTGMSNRFFGVLPNGRAWISTWIGPYGGNKAGVYLTFAKGEDSDAIYQQLLAQRSEIEKDIGLPTTWTSRNGKHVVSTDKQFVDVLSAEERNHAHEFLSDTLNRYVNALRHRLVSLDTKNG